PRRAAAAHCGTREETGELPRVFGTAVERIRTDAGKRVCAALRRFAANALSNAAAPGDHRDGGGGTTDDSRGGRKARPAVCLLRGHRGGALGIGGATAAAGEVGGGV